MFNNKERIPIFHDNTITRRAMISTTYFTTVYIDKKKIIINTDSYLFLIRAHNLFI